tara:strand:+ start:4704 stop:6272 length:1569 start_codon:yes stop_codon:yes gene_type:complete
MANQNDYIINVLAKGVGKTQKDLKGLNSSLGKMTKAVGVVSAAYFGATGLISGVMGAVDAFSRQEEAEKSLRFALGSNTQALLNQASALQKVTAFGDEAIIEQQTFLASLKFSEDQIKSIIPVALDLAEATGISLESAVRNTSKTFSGLAGELGELVPQLRGLTKEQMMAGEAVKVMGDLFEGQAEARAKTLSGQLQQLTNILGDTAEAFGELLVPIVLPLASGLRLIAEGATNVINAFKFKEEFPEIIKQFSDADIVVQDFANSLEGKTLPQLMELNREINAMEFMFNPEDIEVVTRKSEILNNLMNKMMQDALTADVEMANLDFKKMERQDLVFEKQKTREKEMADGVKKFEALKKKSRNESIESSISALVQLNNASVGSAKVTARLMQTQAVIDTYAGANRALATGVPPFSYIQAAATIAMGLANVVQIEKGLSKYEYGGMVGGKRHSQGGTIIEAEQGEFVMSRDAVSRIGINNLNAMNQGASGTTINISAPLLDDTIVDSIIPKIEEAVRRGSDLGV